jgi:hypothetical protein
MHFYSVCKELSASTCFEHYLLIFRRRYTNDTWYIACVLCQLAALELEFHSNPSATNWHKDKNINCYCLKNYVIKKIYVTFNKENVDRSF